MESPVISLEQLKLEMSNFCTHVGYVNSYSVVDRRPPKKRLWSVSYDPLKFFGLTDIFGMADATVVKFCTRIGSRGVVRSNDSFDNIF